MIIKSISHRNTKRSSMQKLINYIFNEQKISYPNAENQPIILKQFLRGYDWKTWGRQYKQNDDGRTFSYANGRRTVLRHDVISFSPKSTPFLNRNTLREIAKMYLQKRSPDSLGCATVHYEKDHVHIHFVISAVSISGLSTRISRKDFALFKKEFQDLQQEKYPMLHHSIVRHGKKKPCRFVKLSRRNE